MAVGYLYAHVTVTCMSCMVFRSYTPYTSIRARSWRKRWFTKIDKLKWNSYTFERRLLLDMHINVAQIFKKRPKNVRISLGHI